MSFINGVKLPSEIIFRANIARVENRYFSCIVGYPWPSIFDELEPQSSPARELSPITIEVFVAYGRGFNKENVAPMLGQVALLTCSVAATIDQKSYVRKARLFVRRIEVGTLSTSPDPSSR